MDLNFLKDNFKTAIDDAKNLNHNSNYNSKILNLFYDYGELCHLEYFKILKKNNDFFTICVSIKALK